MTTAASVYPPRESRPLKDTIVLFDVDETLSKARRVRLDNPQNWLLLTLELGSIVSHSRDARVAFSIAPQVCHRFRPCPFRPESHRLSNTF